MVRLSTMLMTALIISVLGFAVATGITDNMNDYGLELSSEEQAQLSSFNSTFQEVSKVQELASTSESSLALNSSSSTDVVTGLVGSTLVGILSMKTGIQMYKNMLEVAATMIGVPPIIITALSVMLVLTIVFLLIQLFWNPRQPL